MSRTCPNALGVSQAPPRSAAGTSIRVVVRARPPLPRESGEAMVRAELITVGGEANGSVGMYDSKNAFLVAMSVKFQGISQVSSNLQI